MWLLKRTGWLLYQLSIAAGMALAAPYLLAPWATTRYLLPTTSD